MHRSADIGPAAAGVAEAVPTALFTPVTIPGGGVKSSEAGTAIIEEGGVKSTTCWALS